MNNIIERIKALQQQQEKERKRRKIEYQKGFRARLQEFKRAVEESGIKEEMEVVARELLENAGFKGKGYKRYNIIFTQPPTDDEEYKNHPCLVLVWGENYQLTQDWDEPLEFVEIKARPGGYEGFYEYIKASFICTSKGEYYSVNISGKESFKFIKREDWSNRELIQDALAKAFLNPYRCSWQEIAPPP